MQINLCSSSVADELSSPAVAFVSGQTNFIMSSAISYQYCSILKYRTVGLVRRLLTNLVSHDLVFIWILERYLQLYVNPT